MTVHTMVLTTQYTIDDTKTLIPGIPWATLINLILASLLAVLICVTCCTMCLLWCRWRRRMNTKIKRTHTETSEYINSPVSPNQMNTEDRPPDALELSGPSLPKQSRKSVIVEGKLTKMNNARNTMNSKQIKNRRNHVQREHVQREQGSEPSLSTEIESASDFTLHGNVLVSTPDTNNKILTVIHDHKPAPHNEQINVTVMPHIDEYTNDGSSSCSVPPTLPGSLCALDGSHLGANRVTPRYMSDDESSSSTHSVIHHITNQGATSGDNTRTNYRDQ
eukprot:359965_1